MSLSKSIKYKPLANSSLGQVITEYAHTCYNHPNALGEILREWAFIGNGYGCYENFDVREEFIKQPITEREFKFLMSRPSEVDHENTWGFWDEDVFTRGEWYKHPNGIEMGWFWDGDGTLAFFIPEMADEIYTGILINGDCKHDNEWDFQDYDDIMEYDGSD